jgi:hypothetical protein
VLQVPVIAAVPQTMAAFVPGGVFRRLQIPRLCALEVLKQAVREAFGVGNRLDIAFRFGSGEVGPAFSGGGLLPLTTQDMLEAAHRSRETRGLQELPLEVFDVVRGLEGTGEGSLFDGFSGAATPAVVVLRPKLAMPADGLGDFGGPGGLDSPMPIKAQALPPYTQVSILCCEA